MRTKPILIHIMKNCALAKPRERHVKYADVVREDDEMTLTVISDGG